jgi:hypothetical protein
MIPRLAYGTAYFAAFPVANTTMLRDGMSSSRVVLYVDLLNGML